MQQAQKTEILVSLTTDEIEYLRAAALGDSNFWGNKARKTKRNDRRRQFTGLENTYMKIYDKLWTVANSEEIVD